LDKKYHYVRWQWQDRIDIDKLADELSEEYKVEPIKDHGWDLELTFMKEFRDRYIIKSDTLTVFLSIIRVILAQKVSAPFTEKDLKLRGRILELFPKQRPTFLPWQSNTEPEFETIESINDDSLI
jgi:3-methyladenine DNA glycosylase/8-oxoguanine DNA glycosylase